MSQQAAQVPIKSELTWFAGLIALPLLIYLSAAIAVLAPLGLRVRFFWSDWIQSGVVMALIVGLVLGYTGVLSIIERFKSKDRPLQLIVWHRMKPWLTRRLVMRMLMILVFDTVAVVVYLSFKQYAPLIVEGVCDPELVRMDRLLHFGIDPYPSWPLAFLGPGRARLIESLYLFWFGLKIPLFAYFLLQPSRRYVHFFSSFFLVFMINGSIAVGLPSLGPCYHVPHPEVQATISPLASGQAQMFAMVYYEAVIDNPHAYVRNPLTGLAAFPSLHVGFVALMCCFFSNHSRRYLFWFWAVYWVVVEYGSVYLGWHYAVDGYFSSLVCYLIYLGVGKLLYHKFRFLTPADD